MHWACVFTTGNCGLCSDWLASNSDLSQQLRRRRKVPSRIAAKLFNAVLAAKEKRLSLEFESSSRRVLVHGHATNGINRVSGIEMSMTVIHFSQIVNGTVRKNKRPSATWQLGRCSDHSKWI